MPTLAIIRLHRTAARSIYKDMNRTGLRDVLAVDVVEAARRLGLSPRTVATLVAAGKLESRRVGRRRLIPIGSLKEFLKQDHATSRKKA
jgi:excisionase family DNA binding protein